MRTPTACAQCRRNKRRCIRHEHRAACASCQQRQLNCESKAQTRRVGQRALAPQPLATFNTSRHTAQKPENQLRPSPDLSSGVAIELVEHYLDKFHGRPYTIFHPASLRSEVHSGTLKKTLLYAICAIGCKFSRNPAVRNQDSDLAAESKRLLQGDITNICLENIQACILVAILSVGHSNHESEALFFRIAAAMAEIMNLDSPAPAASLIDQEIRRRVWYALYMTDMWCISGQGLRSHLNNVPTKPELPINDWTFLSLHSGQSSVVNALEPGIWAQMVTLVPLFAPIHNINRLIADGETYTTDLDQQVQQLAGKLEDWRHKLPLDAQMNLENLHRQQKKGLGGLLISTHLAYHHFATLLYFRYLEVQRPTASTDQTYIARCKNHASSFSSLLRQSRQLKGCEVVYPNLGHMATVSSSVLVHTLLFGDLNELEPARQELNSNFEALMELAQYWPSASAMIERLTLFQDVCLLSTEPGTHKLDGWMLRFLIEHSLAIEVKRMQKNLNADSAKLLSRAKELAEKGRYMAFQSL